MNSAEAKKLFQQIFECNDEDALHKIVCSEANLKSAANWYPYGGKDKDDRSNFGTFENQQADSGAALVEKITNSIDALLLKRCKQERIDPKSKAAPKEMEEATKQFFDIPNGDIGELSSSQRVALARENMQVVATGSDDRPNLMIYDNGEGQHPDNFKNTFLSIAQNNKTDIPFVQGKYNMGSTGAVVFCGEHRYQLVASKMDSSVFKQQDKFSENLFGWTLVRRHELTDDENELYGSSWYEYFALDSERIPQFDVDELDIGLYNGKKFITGSFVKLFSYELPRGTKGPIWDGLYIELNQLLYKPALPITLYESRKSKQQEKRYDVIEVYGNYVRLNPSDNPSDLLDIAPVYVKVTGDKDFGEVTLHAVVIKKDERKRQRQYIGTGRNVVYVLNGQVQGSEGQTFITKRLKYNFLKDSMLVVVDCSKMKTGFRQDLFMANRSNLRQNEKLRKLNESVVDRLKDNADLRSLNEQRKNAILQGKDDAKEKEIIHGLLSKVPLDESLVKLLKKGIDPINLPSVRRPSNKGSRQKLPRAGERFPSIFKIDLKEDKDSGKKVKSIPLNGKGIITFETDVDDRYFYRPNEKGELQIHVLGGKDWNDTGRPGQKPSLEPTAVEDFFDVSISGPSDGSIKLTLKPKSNLAVKDEINLNARLTSPNGDIESIFYVKIINSQKHHKTRAKPKPEHPNLPKLIKVTKTDSGWEQDNGEAWKEDSWTSDSVVHIVTDSTDASDASMVSAIAINMESNSLKQYISKGGAKSENEVVALKNKYISSIYLHALFLYSIIEKQHSYDAHRQNQNQPSEQLVARIFQDYANVIVYLDSDREIFKALSDE